ncbi:Nif3-like dinuclear metal center hexameric protein [Armatimonas rosea]|uniref:GTP cyclohydrolase 1 type 2 homolog n=1 Tax=Armatimonas rosea TaxID=685828 RepID=A0A7W9SUQ3_ARMRO|nr:Nif3-like dinuclear metal center hexameric protein [Armatimonas rosea]MBB6052720.1 dinuclear metal center YbgI/SA1388 family protein [Armatimonas rosea]
MTTIRDAIAALDQLAPPYLTLGSDPRGLLIGDSKAPLTGIVACLDVTHRAVEAARKVGASLIVAHHPLIYQPARTLLADEPHPGSVVLACARHGLSVACAHTNWDVAQGGINDVLAELVGLTEVKVLRVTAKESGDGIGRVGLLREPLSATDFLNKLGNVLGIAPRTLTPTRALAVQTVAVCGGAGAELLADALAAGADTLVTGDIRHHEFVAAAEQGFLLIDGGHHATENPGARELGRRLELALPGVAVTFVG